MSIDFNANADIIGRAEINDIDAILAIPIPTRRGRARRQGQRRRHLHVGLLARPPGAAQAVREGQDRPVERDDRPALGHRGRRREDRRRRPGGSAPVLTPIVYIGTAGREVGRQGVARVRHREPQLDPQPVPARRAGRTALHREDRRDGAVVRRQAVRLHPGRRRGPPRRGLRPLPRREARSAPTRSTPTCGCCSTTSSTTAAGT